METLNPAVASAKPVPHPAERPAAGSDTILVIDDDEACRFMISKILRHHGHQVIEAADGLAGVKLARTGHIDLILCDINMGWLDGNAAASVLRLHPATATIPLIMMTGQASFSGMRHSMSLGADDYLAKPFGEPELMAAVNMRLQKHRETQTEAERKMVEVHALLPKRLANELLTPIDEILAFSEVVLTTSDSLNRSEVLRMAGAIRRSARRLHRQIQNYLFLAELNSLGTDEAKRKSLCQGKTSAVETVAKGAALECAERWSRTGDLVLEFAASRVAMSEEFMRKLVDELVDNACKFSEAGSKLHVSTSISPAGIEFALHDHGCGLTPEQIAQVGEYQQFDQKLREPQGLGLGLAIARRLVELHGGTLSIRSDPATGTLVAARLPASAA
jgi:signal transduction histidine kinase